MELLNDFSRKKLNICIFIIASGILLYFWKLKTRQHQQQAEVFFQIDSETRSSNPISRIEYIGNQSWQSYTTVITVLFNFKKSKHKHNEYEKWSEKMLKSIGAPFVAFVDNFWAERFIKHSKNFNLTGLFFISFFIVPDFQLIFQLSKFYYFTI